MPDSVSPDTLRRIAQDVLRIPAKQLDFASLAPLVEGLLAETREMDSLRPAEGEPYVPSPSQRWER